MDEVKLTDVSRFSTSHDNFKKIESAFNENVDDTQLQLEKKEDISKHDNDIQSLNNKIDNVQSDLKAQIKRITLGVDEEALERVLTKILQTKGVI